MALSSRGRAAIYTGLSELIEEDAVEDMLTNFPAREVDEPVTRDFLDARLAEVEARIIGRVDQRFAAVDEKFAAIDKKFAAIDERFAVITQRFGAVDEKFAELSRQMDEKFASNLRWTVGLVIATPSAIAAIQALLG